METSLEYIEIYPKIHVYKNLLPDADKLYRIIKESEKDAAGKYYLRTWDKWSIFGTYTQIKHLSAEDRELGQRHDDEKYLADRVAEAYGMAVDHYVETTGAILPEGAGLVSSSFSKYNPETEESSRDDMSMQYHLDYIHSERDEPGKKFLITCTTYINDDYEGGALEFYINGDVVYYKPEAGDIVVFPSVEPYYHGVTGVKKLEKFFIRNFIMYDFPGTDEWLMNQRTFGAARWADTERARRAEENKMSQLYRLNGEIVSFEKYREYRQASANKETPNGMM